VKTPAQQAILAVYRLREGYKADRTARINRIRGLLAEFGINFARTPDELRLGLADALGDASNELPGIARLALQQARLHWIELDSHIASCDEPSNAHARSDEQAAAAAKLCSIGPVTASAMVATVGGFRQFKSGSQFASWLALVPRQNSSGGKAQLGRITKRGDDYLRTLLIQGAKSAVMTAHKRTDKISQWLVQLVDRVGWQKAVVALANKNARIVWALLAKGRGFDPNHVSVNPGQMSATSVSTPTPQHKKFFLVDVRSEMQFIGQTGSSQARRTHCRAN